MGRIAIIPARYDSVRFPGKLLEPLAGRPLIQHVAERCLRIPAIDAVVVATDDDRIATAASALDVAVVMTSSALASGTDRVAAAAAQVEGEIVLNVQGDEPLIDPEALGASLDAFAASGADYGTLRAPLGSFADLLDPNVVKVVVDRQGRALYFSRAPVPYPREALRGVTADAAGAVALESAGLSLDCYWQHVGVYMYRRPALAEWARIPRSSLERLEGLEQLRILEAGKTMQTFPVSEAIPGVDTPEDLERVRRWVERG